MMAKAVSLIFRDAPMCYDRIQVAASQPRKMLSYARSQPMDAPMVQVETFIPGDVYLTLQAQGLHRSVLAEESAHLLALHFFQDHVLSLGNAARLAGMNLWDFTAYLSQNNVAVVDLDADELAAEFVAVAQLSDELVGRDRE
jgi:predicted HTH domain antitoxin